MQVTTRLALVAFAVLGLIALGQADNEPSPDVGTVIGIDLGTTYSCVAVFRNGRVDIISNDQGHRIEPSYVAFGRDGERLVGDAAKNQATLNPSNTIYDIKRFIGREWTDKTVAADRAMLPFKLENKNQKPRVVVKVDGKKKTFSPEEISAMILQKMKATAEAFLGKKVTSAVVTVPAYFNDAQRQATKDAGVIAGLNVLRIINEPTAAAIAYGLEKMPNDVKVLVYDLGGGTFDVSILTIDGGIFEVLATNGDTHLGGEDFDHRILEHLSKIASKKFGVDLSKHKRSIAKLKKAAEDAKRTLSTMHSVKIELDSFVDGEDFVETLTRAKFEQLCEDLFQKTLGPVKKVLKDADLRKNEIDEIVLVGGSTRIPKVQELLSKFFNGKALNHEVNPDEAVAFGAAVQGGVLSGEGGDAAKSLLLLDVIPLTIGIELTGGVMMPFIERNSVIPAKMQKVVTTERDYQTSVPIKVFQGERPKTKDNMLLGQFAVSNLPPLKRGQPKVEVTFQIDANGILQVAAHDSANKKSGGKITITADKGRLSEKEIERMVREAEKFADSDSDWKESREKESELKQYVYGLQHAVKEAEDMSEDDKTTVVEACQEAEEWIDNLDGDKRSAQDFEDKKEELEDTCGPIMAGMYGTPEGAGGGDDDDFDDDEDWDEHDEL